MNRTLTYAISGFLLLAGCKSSDKGGWYAMDTNGKLVDVKKIDFSERYDNARLNLESYAEFVEGKMNEVERAEELLRRILREDLSDEEKGDMLSAVEIYLIMNSSVGKGN